MAKVTIYTTPECPYCKAAKEFFKKNKIKYSEKDATKPAVAKEAVDKSGQTGVPVIDIDGKIIVGFDEAKLSKALGIK